MAKVMDAAAAVQAAHGSEPLSWRKLHKLLYFCQGWSLAWRASPLFADSIQAWKDGPVVKEVWRIQRHYPTSERGRREMLSPEDDSIVREVVSFYRRYDTRTLVELTHREPPWRDARGGLPAGAHSAATITVGAIESYFSGIRVALGSSDRTIPAALRRTIDVLLSVPEDGGSPMDVSDLSFDDALAYLRGGRSEWPPPDARQQPPDRG